MDVGAMKERNYRMVEQLRHQNEREQRRLEKTLHSKHGVIALHRYQLEGMSREERKIKEELAKIRQTVSTTWGLLPPRDGEATNEIPTASHKHTLTPRGATEDGESKKKKKKTRHLKKANMTSTAGRLQLFNKTHPIEGDTEDPTKLRVEGNLDSLQSAIDGTQHEDCAVSGTEPPNRNHERHTDDVIISMTDDVIISMTDGTKENRAKRPNNPSNRRQTSIAHVDITAAKSNIAKRLTPNLDRTKEHTLMPSRETSFSKRQSSPQPDTLILEKAKLETEVTAEESENTITSHLHKSNSCIQTKDNIKTSQRNGVGKKKAKEEAGDAMVFDSMRYNPDGSLRKVHELPDPADSITQAAKTRYVRNKNKPWYEKALSVQQVFDKNHREKSLLLFSTTVK